MTTQEIKTAIDTFGRNNITSNSVIELKNGQFEIKNTHHFQANQVSLMDCVFDFSRDFNNEEIESILPEINSLIETSKSFDLIGLHNS